MSTVYDLSEAYISQESMFNMEGDRGVDNMCKLVEAIGYKDPQFFGTLSNGASLGSLQRFLADNSGCLQVMVEWIQSNNVPEWAESLKTHLDNPPEDEDEEGEPA